MAKKWIQYTFDAHAWLDGYPIGGSIPFTSLSAKEQKQVKKTNRITADTLDGRLFYVRKS